MASMSFLSAEEIPENITPPLIFTSSPVSASSAAKTHEDHPASPHTPASVTPTSPLEFNKTTHSMERTFIILKPDCVQHQHIGDVILRFESARFAIIACKMTVLSDAILREHYAHIAHLPFFPEIVEFMSSSPVILMILEGENCIARVREILGITDSQAAAPGTIRKTWGSDKMRNIAHASDSLESAQIEIRRFFKPEEIFSTSSAK
jgi:nucleoside-diphosphate kinase